MMQCGTELAETFKTMAGVSEMINVTPNFDDGENMPSVYSGNDGITRRISFSSEKDISSQQEPNETCQVSPLHGVQEDLNSSRPSTENTEQLSWPTVNTPQKADNETESMGLSLEYKQRSNHLSVNNAEDKENISAPSTTTTSDNTHEEVTSGQRDLQDSLVSASKQHSHTEDNDAVVLKRAQEQGCVNVVFPGTVTQEGCCRFVSEILKCVLYQRQQLPMTYDQLVYSQKKQQASMQDKDTVSGRPLHSADMGWRKCQQTLQDLEEVLQQLEVLFSLSRVPRVLLLMGGSLILPKELYEINMEALVLAGGDQCLRVSSCLRQLFRTLFVADLLSDTRPVHLMPTTVLVLAHRDCGVGWFRPKLQFKVPTRVRNQIIALQTDPSTCKEQRSEGSAWHDYVWFQAPMTIKGFSN